MTLTRIKSLMTTNPTLRVKKMGDQHMITKKDLETFEQRVLFKMFIINLLCIGFSVGIVTCVVR